MGIVIYPAGDLTVTSKNPEEIVLEDQIKEIEEIRDHFEKFAFAVSEEPDGIHLNMADYMEGWDPYEDDVMKPLEQLISYCTMNKLLVNGTIEIKSNTGDYDNIMIMIKDNYLKTVNSQIYNASTEELKDELKRREGASKEKSENSDLGTFSVGVELQPNGLYDAYVYHDGSSGSHYKDIDVDKIGEYVAEEIDCVAEDNDNYVSPSSMCNSRMKELLDHIVEHESVARTCKETIKHLLYIGFTEDELIKFFNFGRSDVTEASQEMNNYEED